MNAKLIIDIGIAETKCNVIYNNIDEMFVIENKFCNANGLRVGADCTEENSVILNINKNFMGNLIANNYANGLICKDVNQLDTLKFGNSAKMPKYTQDVIVLIMNTVLYKAINTLKNAIGVEYGGINMPFDIIILASKNEIVSAKPVLNDLLHELKTINLIYPSIVLQVNINKIFFLPRGYCAYTSCVFDKHNEYIEDNKYLIDENVLVCDIGSLQTDFMIIDHNEARNFNLVVNSGLNKIFDNVTMNMLLIGITIRNEDIKNYLKTGESEYADAINKNIMSEFENIVSKIILELTDSLESQGINLSVFDSVLVCGKGNIFNFSDVFEKQLSIKANKEIKLVKYDYASDDLNILGANVLSELI